MARQLVSTKDMPREKWLEYRRMSIGGSDSATIVGLNPYGCLLELYADKKGLLPDKEDNEAMRQGRDLEQYVAQRWEEATGKKCHRTNFMYVHDKYDFISANVDRVVVGENAGLECKTTSVYNKSDFENGEIPLNYYVQCTHYMAVMGYEKMYLAVLVLNKGFFYFEIERKEEEIESLINAEITFWNNHILTNTQPQPDGSESAQNTLNVLYPSNKSKGTEILLMEYEDKLERYTELQEQIKDLKKQADAEKQSIVSILGNNCYGTAQKYKVSYIPQVRTSIDTRTLKKDMPDIYEQYSKTSEYKTFRIKKSKEK